MRIHMGSGRCQTLILVSLEFNLSRHPVRVILVMEDLFNVRGYREPGAPVK